MAITKVASKKNPGKPTAKVAPSPPASTAAPAADDGGGGTDKPKEAEPPPADKAKEEAAAKPKPKPKGKPSTKKVAEEKPPEATSSTTDKTEDTPATTDKQDDKEKEEPPPPPAEPEEPPPAPLDGALNDEAENKEKMKNGCQKCCGNFMRILANDAIYGSFIGPHPVSFLCCCRLLSKRKSHRKPACARPFSVASIATKLMNLLLFLFTSLLASFFIIPWPLTGLSFASTSLASFRPCLPSPRPIHNHLLNGGCSTHAGHFMVYRCFLAYSTLTLTLSLLVLLVTSTRDDPYRSRIHHGFWLYKYLYLFLLLLLYFLLPTGSTDPTGIFEFTCSILGHLCHFLLTFISLTFILDILELWIISNKSSTSPWAPFFYWLLTSIVVLTCLILYSKLWIDYSTNRLYKNFTSNKLSHQWPPWPLDNCIPGEKTTPDWKHTSLILATLALVMLLLIVTAFRKMFGVHERYPYQGWLQTAMVTLFNITYLWSSLSNSSNVHSRPRCNLGLDLFSSNPKINDTREGVQEGSWDIYLKFSGLFHGVIILITLLYYMFVHGPRSDTAPLSNLYTVLFRCKDRIPVFPGMGGGGQRGDEVDGDDDEEDDPPIGYLYAVANSLVWDDEQISVAQSWSGFYGMLTLGGMSMMMAMTNFSDPWAGNYYNSSEYAFWGKWGSGLVWTLVYIGMLVCPCKKIHEQERQLKKMRRRSVLEPVVEVDHGGDEEDGKDKKRGFRFHIAGLGEDGGRKSVKDKQEDKDMDKMADDDKV